MARKRDFGALGENAHLGVVRGLARRQHEGGLGIIELGGNRLHLRGRKPAGVEHHGERIAAEGAVGENVDSDVASSLHGALVWFDGVVWHAALTRRRRRLEAKH
jgi:hypothetical protein